MIVPLPAGGPTDQLARQIAPKLSEKLGQNVIIENVSGGATTIGTARVARAAPDGYTLLMHSLQVSSNPGLYPKLPFDTEKDLVPIIFINYNPIVLIGRKSLAANTFAELVPWMKAKPAKFAIAGLGTTGHMTTVQLLKAIGVEADIVPYRGAAPAMQDILGEHVDLYFAAPQSLVQAVQVKSVKAYGLTSREGSPLLPGVPSLVDLVGPQMEVRYWSALLTRAGTPQPMIDKINAAVQDAMKDPVILKIMGRHGRRALSAGAAHDEGRTGFLPERDQALGRGDPRQQDRSSDAVRKDRPCSNISRTTTPGAWPSIWRWRWAPASATSTTCRGRCARSPRTMTTPRPRCCSRNGPASATRSARFAEADEARGRGISAGEKYRRATIAYVQAERMQRPGFPGREGAYESMLACFAKFIALERTRLHAGRRCRTREPACRRCSCRRPARRPARAHPAWCISTGSMCSRRSSTCWRCRTRWRSAASPRSWSIIRASARPCACRA